MMLLCTRLVVTVCALLLLAWPAAPAAWLATLPNKPQHLAHKEGCYIAEINDVIPFGEEAFPAGRCERIVCEKRYIDYASCPAAEASASCHEVPARPGLAYPECCPFLKCDENNLVI